MSECEACGSPYCFNLECMEPDYGAMADEEMISKMKGGKK